MAKTINEIVKKYESEASADNYIDMHIRMTFIADVLGTATTDPNIYSQYIASNAPYAPSKEEEIEALGVDAVVEKGTTVFPKDENGNPIIWDYQIRGFFKSACSALQRCNGVAKHTSKMKAFRKILDQCIFVYPRKIKIKVNGEMGICQRPLRASTAQGDRVAIASSETVPKGSTIEFTVRTLNEDWVMAILEWLDYGQYNGMLQWRNSGAGAFVYEVLDDDGNVIGGNKDRESGKTWVEQW